MRSEPAQRIGAIPETNHGRAGAYCPGVHAGRRSRHPRGQRKKKQDNAKVRNRFCKHRLKPISARRRYSPVTNDSLKASIEKHQADLCRERRSEVSWIREPVPAELRRVWRGVECQTFPAIFGT